MNFAGRSPGSTARWSSAGRPPSRRRGSTCGVRCGGWRRCGGSRSSSTRSAAWHPAGLSAACDGEPHVSERTDPMTVERPGTDRAADTGSLLADCVHCGFCLPTCPTYRLWGEEMDSPRGRIELMRQVHDGQPLDATVVPHFDRCLGCMACVTACPSGVKYDVLIETTRAQVEDHAAGLRPLSERALRSLIFALFPHHRR